MMTGLCSIPNSSTRQYLAAPIRSCARVSCRKIMGRVQRLLPSLHRHLQGQSVTRQLSFFIAHREVWTTESPAGTALEGARWPGPDSETLLTSIIEASAADGWMVITHPSAGKLLGTPDVVLQRGNLYRELQIVRFDDTGILQLWDVPTSWFDSRPV